MCIQLTVCFFEMYNVLLRMRVRVRVQSELPLMLPNNSREGKEWSLFAIANQGVAVKSASVSNKT